MTFLDVPFREKDHAKSLGARWDAVSKRWYIPDSFDGDIEPFSRWMPQNTQSNPPTMDLDFNPAHGDLKEKGSKLSDILYKVQNALRSSFPGAAWVIAEIANINTRRGHVYLELTETSEQGQTIASCRGMIWQSQAERLLQRFELETGSALAAGQKVLLLAEVTFHAQYGFSFVVQDLDPSYTLGEQEQKLNQIRKNLIQKRIYQQNKTLCLADDFFHIAVIAPPEAAGLGDFRADADILQQHKLCEFKYFYSSFQGEAVEKEMLAALDAVIALHQTNPFDALVVIRGGGAKLDLNMLNIEPVAEYLCSLPLPLLSGIGHERDNTIIDEIAHSRFDTPSKVIGFVKNRIFQQAKIAETNWHTIEKSSRIEVQKLHNTINQLQSKITHNSQNVTNRWQKLIEPIHHEINRLSLSMVAQAKQRIELTEQRIHASATQKLERAAFDVENLNLAIKERSLRSIEIQKQQIVQSVSFILSSGPKAQLNRGFSIVKNEQGTPITTAKQALQHTTVELEFTDGSITAKIEKNQEIKKPV